MSKPENKRRAAGATGGEGSESAYDPVVDQQTMPSAYPSSATQSRADSGGGASTDATNQVAAQLAELLRNNPDALRDVLAQAGQSSDSSAGQQQHPLSRFDKQKENFVKGLGSIVEEARQMNRNLRRSEQSGIVPLVAQYGDLGVDGIERLSNYLTGKNVSELVSEAARFAQRNATYLVPGAFLLGLAGARFLKSSNPTQAMTEGLPNSETDVALPTLPPQPAPLGDSAAAAARVTAGSTMPDRTPQPPQAGYMAQNQDAKDETRVFVSGADHGTLERDDPADFMGVRARSS